MPRPAATTAAPSDPGATRLDRSVQLGPCQYRVLIRAGAGARAALTAAARDLGAARFLLVAAARTPADQLAEAAATLAPAGELLVLRGAPGVPLSFPEPTPDTVVVLLGGRRALRAGLACAGRARLVHLPTTLAAMCDAAVGVQPDGAGGLRAPAQVWCRPDLLRGPQHAGLYPLLRNVLAICPYHLRAVADRLRPDGRYPAPVLAAFVALCVEARAGVLAYDPLGTGPGTVLRYGEGTLQGLLRAARTARRLGLLDAADEAAHHELLAAAGVRVVPSEPTPEVAELVLLRALGHPHTTAGSLLTPVRADRTAVDATAVADADTLDTLDTADTAAPPVARDAGRPVPVRAGR
ncbi:hypothetical protein [Kitasatospora sp. LaBMicrA B282]|uniref:hypothetical protein n=1 Tax=Kitasatospora sp. LaBMicrA B282 TaxID=3420949 RepID=UPI003D14125B